ncbi:hypothetical protein N9891_02170, partial [bacterium]|nr:hypothetical protein [bacterium]
MRCRVLQLLVAGSFIGALFGVSSAATMIVVSDGFDDGGRTNGTDASDIAWYESFQTGSSTPTSDLSVSNDSGVPGIGGGNALFLDSGGTFSRLSGVFNDTTLAVGETLGLSFDMRFTSNPGAITNGLRVGFYNDGGTTNSSDTSNGATVFNDDYGYGFATNLGSASSFGTSVRQENNGGSTGAEGITGGPSPYSFNGVSGSSSGASTIWGTSSRSVQFTITRLSDGSLDLLASIDGGTAATGNVISPFNSNYTFNEVAIGLGGFSSDFYIDNVLIQV